MISAGHCLDNLKIVEFKTRGTNEYGSLNKTKNRDIFTVDPKSINSVFKINQAEDWVVFRVKKKKLSFWKRAKAVFKDGFKGTKSYRSKQGYYPGDIQRSYSIADNSPNSGTQISITGYGDSLNRRRALTQQIGFGKIISKPSEGTIDYLFHNVDTEGGVSGAAMMNRKNEIVGIHTGGLCRYSIFFNRTVCINRGIDINGTFRFRNAIRDCLSWEKKNL